MVFNWCRRVRARGFEPSVEKFGERENVVSLMSVVVVANGRMVVVVNVTNVTVW